MHKDGDRVSVYIYGAYDRYNYGDNLMPILLTRYLNETLGDEILDFKYVSILKSDLSHYDCLPTVALSECVDDIRKEDFIIVVGGEVLAASAGNLYLHVQNSPKKVFLLKVFRKLLPKIYVDFSKKQMKALWSYPYIPDKNKTNINFNVIYNTVGGIPPISQFRSIQQATYFSARDQRTYDVVSEVRETELVPDSVLLVSRYFKREDIFILVKNKNLCRLQNSKYVVFQACPYKIKNTAADVASELIKLKKTKGVNVILLPIGYASGHDDVVFLKEVHQIMGGEAELLYELTVWEIMYVIAMSCGFYGTSLHGVITAMAYNAPHYCMNEDIHKLISFMETWSVEPFVKPLAITEMKNSLIFDVNSNNEVKDALSRAVNAAQDIIDNSMKRIAALMA